MIHSFNKNETVLQGTDYYETVQDRTSIIVMGDSLGDAHMANGSPTSSHVLKIGFLYEHVNIQYIFPFGNIFSQLCSLSFIGKYKSSKIFGCI